MAKCKDHNELAHEFAYSEPNWSNENRSGNMSYSGDTCWSYETKIAKKYPKDKIIIITEYTYSNTTRRQIQELLSAFSHWTIIRSNILDLSDTLIDKYTELHKYTRKAEHCYRLKGTMIPNTASHRQRLLDLFGTVDMFIFKGYIDPKHITEDDKAVHEAVLKYEEKLASNRYNRHINHWRCRQDIIDECIDLFKHNGCSSIGEIIAKSKDIIKQKDKIGKGEYQEVIATLLGIKNRLIRKSDDRRENVYGEMVWIYEGMICTNKGICLPVDKYLDTIYRLLKLYLVGKHDLLVGKHIHSYEILFSDDDKIQIGCHTFQRPFIEQFEIEYNLYKKDHKDDAVSNG